MTLIDDFKKKHKDFLEGVIEDKETEGTSYIKSLRVQNKEPERVFLITLPDDMIIPSVALTKGDEVYVHAVQDETDRKNGYDGSLRGIANIDTGKVYEFTGIIPNEHLRVIVPVSEVMDEM